jgi:GNAT superfamily N-acetyltransferase
VDPLLQQLQQYTRTLALRSRSNLRVGPFVCRFDPGWPNPYANYAIPDENAEPTAADVRALISVFEEHERRPRLECLPHCAPAVEGALLAAGFEVEDRASVMICPPGELVVPAGPPDLEFAEPRGDEELDALAAVQHRAFGEPGEPAKGIGGGLRRTYRNGGVVLLARLGGEPVAGGACSAPVEGITELTGVAVAEAFRSRGIGAALSAELTALAHARGYHLPWLEPADKAVERVYARIGYRPVGEKLSISLPQGADRQVAAE